MGRVSPRQPQVPPLPSSVATADGGSSQPRGPSALTGRDGLSLPSPLPFSSRQASTSLQGRSQAEPRDPVGVQGSPPGPPSPTMAEAASHALPSRNRCPSQRWPPGTSLQ